MPIILIFPSLSSLHVGFHLSFPLSPTSVSIASSCSVSFLLSAWLADVLHAEQGLERAGALPAAGEAVLPLHLMPRLCPLIIRMCWIQQSHFSLVWQHISRVGESPTLQHTLIQEDFPQQTRAFFSSGKRELDSHYGHPAGCSWNNAIVLHHSSTWKHREDGAEGLISCTCSWDALQNMSSLALGWEHQSACSHLLPKAGTFLRALGCCDNFCIPIETPAC